MKRAARQHCESGSFFPPSVPFVFGRYLGAAGLDLADAEAHGLGAVGVGAYGLGAAR